MTSDPVEAARDAGGPVAGHPAAGHAEVVRSEERLSVTGRVRPVGRVRIGKRVVTEERSVTVTLRREELFVEDLPAESTEAWEHSAGAPARGATPEPLVIVLSEEEPVVSVRAVPRELVTVRVERRSEQEQVSATVAHEVVEVDGIGSPTEPGLRR